jgi:hypothetical protein
MLCVSSNLAELFGLLLHRRFVALLASNPKQDGPSERGFTGLLKDAAVGFRLCGARRGQFELATLRLDCGGLGENEREPLLCVRVAQLLQRVLEGGEVARIALVIAAATGAATGAVSATVAATWAVSATGAVSVSAAGAAAAPVPALL